MPSDNPLVPDDIRRRLADAEQLAIAVDKVVTAPVPDIVDLQVAAAPTGVVVISGVVSSLEHQRRAEAAARAVKGVRQVVMSLTVT